ncbi:MAG: SPOR domain-containing protein [Deltaproteobacteria bacterium]
MAAVLTLGMQQAAAAEEPLGKAEAFYLQKLYVQAIDAAQEAIRDDPNDRELVAHADYLTGAAYVNLFDFLTAKKSFQAVVAKYKDTAYFEDAYLGLADVEFLQENMEEALRAYEAFAEANPSPKRKATLYFRLAEIYLKKGDLDRSRAYLKKLHEEFPASFEARDAGRLSGEKVWYTVQVGAFTDFKNAEAFVNELKVKGYDVYSVLCMLSGKKLCRIRIGRFADKSEAAALQDKLKREGYYSKVFPLTGER